MTTRRSRPQRTDIREQFQALAVWLRAAHDLAEDVRAGLLQRDLVGWHREALALNAERVNVLAMLADDLVIMAGASLTGDVLEALALSSRIACRLLVDNVWRAEQAGHCAHLVPGFTARRKAERAALERELLGETVTPGCSPSDRKETAK